jgi:hypothetical protein
VTRLGGGAAEVVGQDDFLGANIAGYSGVIALEADDVGGAGLSCEPAEDATESAGANIAVRLQQPNAVVRVELGLGGIVAHVPT